MTGYNHPPKAPDLLIRCLAKSLFTTSRLMVEDQLLVNRDTAFLLWLIKCHSPGTLSTKESSTLISVAQEPRHLPVHVPAQPLSNLPASLWITPSVTMWLPHELVCLLLHSGNGSHFPGVRPRAPHSWRLWKFSPHLSLSPNGAW